MLLFQEITSQKTKNGQNAEKKYSAFLCYKYEILTWINLCQGVFPPQLFYLQLHNGWNKEKICVFLFFSGIFGALVSS